MEAEDHFHWADYVIFAAFLCVSFGIGVYHSLTGGRQKTTGEFIMANRKLSVIPTVLSMVMSFLSAIMIIGCTAEMYSYGTMMFVWWLPGLIIGSLFLERLIIPWIYRLQLVSVFDYLEGRFQSKAVRMYGACLGVLHAILYNGVAMFAPSVALESVTGLSVYVSLPVMAVVGTAYTALGGMRAVIWTDVFQCLVMAAGMITVLVKGAVLTGGMNEVFRLLDEHGRVIATNFNPDPRDRSSGWGFLANSVTMSIFIKGLCQASVQRYSATKSLRDARNTIFGNILLNILLVLIGSFTGITVFGYFAKMRCDPIVSGSIYSPNQVLPIFVKKVFAKNYGFSGLFIATLYSGALSSLSSNLSGCAANVWEDLIKPKFGHRFSEEGAAKLNKILVIIAGCLSLGISFMATAMPGPIVQISSTFFGAVGGPMVGLFLLGGLFRFNNWAGGLIGGICGFAFNILIAVGSQSVPPYTKELPPLPVDGCLGYEVYNETLTMYNSTYSPLESVTEIDTDVQQGSILQPLFQVSVFMYGITGFVVTMIVGCAVSLATNAMFPQLRKSLKTVPDKYFIDWSTALTCGNLPPHDSQDDVKDNTIYKPKLIYEVNGKAESGKLLNGEKGNHIAMEEKI